MAIPSILFKGVVGIGSYDMCSGSVLTGPYMYLDMWPDGDVRSPCCAPAKGAYEAPSKSSVSALGVDRRDVGVKGSYAEDADEKLVPADGQAMD